MTPEQIEVERKAFEHKHQTLFGSLFGGRRDKWTGRFEYDSPAVDDRWSGWLARAEKAQRVREALVIAEAALADIGDADREPGDDLAWCERRAAQDLPLVRAALKD